MQFQTWFGTYMFSWRSPSLRGAFFEIGCQQRLIWWLVVWWLMMRSFVFLGVGKWKLLNIYLFPAPYLESFGLVFVIGLVLVGLIRLLFLITSISSGGATSRRSFMQLLWLLCVWVLWNARNDRQFNNTDISIHQMLKKVKINSYWWMKAANAVFVLGVHNWLSCPLLCLGIG